MNNDTRDKIVKDLEIQDLPTEAQDEIIVKMGENLIKAVTIAVIDKVPVDQRDAFEAVGKAGDQTKVREFLSPYIPNFDQFMGEVVREEISAFKAAKAATLAE